MTLRERREALGLTQEAAAAKAGMRQSAYSHIERGYTPNPTIATIQLLAVALDWTEADVMAAVREAQAA
jgi:transcriptional regulator with XRE-family HTH domain